jgi:hypothetical protein
MMSKTIAQLAKWCTIPVLVIASMFSYFAGRYEPLVASVVCLGAIILIQRAVWSREYSWAAGLVAVVVSFSPLPLTVKIFLLMSIACVGTWVAFLGTVRPHAVEAV